MTSDLRKLRLIRAARQQRAGRNATPRTTHHPAKRTAEPESDGREKSYRAAAFDDCGGDGDAAHLLLAIEHLAPLAGEKRDGVCWIAINREKLRREVGTLASAAMIEWKLRGLREMDLIETKQAWFGERGQRAKKILHVRLKDTPQNRRRLERYAAKHRQLRKSKGRQPSRYWEQWSTSSPANPQDQIDPPSPADTQAQVMPSAANLQDQIRSSPANLQDPITGITGEQEKQRTGRTLPPLETLPKKTEWEQEDVTKLAAQVDGCEAPKGGDYARVWRAALCAQTEGDVPELPGKAAARLKSIAAWLEQQQPGTAARTLALVALRWRSFIDFLVNRRGWARERISEQPSHDSLAFIAGRLDAVSAWPGPRRRTTTPTMTRASRPTR